MTTDQQVDQGPEMYKVHLAADGFWRENPEAGLADPYDGDPVDAGYIIFQHGPVAEVGVNGTTIENVAHVLLDRLRIFNNGPFRCRENSLAITHFEEALHWLEARTRARQRQGVEGHSAPHIS